MTNIYVMAIAYYAVVIIGLSGLLIGVCFALMKAYEALLTHFKLYDEFTRFFYDRHRKKRTVIKTEVKRSLFKKEDDE